MPPLFHRSGLYRRSILSSLHSPGAFLFGSLLALACEGTAAAECIDYGDYIHSVGALNMALPRDLAVAGNYAYVADGIDDLQVIDITDPASPVVVDSLSLTGDQMGIAVNGQYVYMVWVGGNAGGLHVVKVSTGVSPTLVATLNLTGFPAGLAVNGTYAYVALGDGGLRIINVSNPANPTLAGAVNTPGTTYSIAVNGNYAYVADGGTGLQVVDVSNPASPSIVGSVDTPGTARGVAVAGQHAYIGDGNAGFHVVDVTNPLAPDLIGTVAVGPLANGVAVSGTRAYLAENFYGLVAIDVSTPSAPVILGVVGSAPSTNVRVQGGYAYTDDFHVIDISNPNQASILGEVDTEGTPHGIAVSGSFAYIANFAGSFQVIDVTDHTDPTLLASMDMVGVFPTDIAVRPPYAYLSTMNRGLHVVDVSNPTAPSVVGSVLTPFAHAHGIAVAGNYAYVVDPHPVGFGPSHLLVIDISNPAVPAIVGDIAFPGTGLDVAVQGNFAYVGGHDEFGEGLRVFDITNPQSPAMVGILPFFYIIEGIAVDGEHVYFSHDDFMGVCDVSIPHAPVFLRRVETPRDAAGIAIAGNHAYVAVGPRGSWSSISPIRAVPEHWGESALQDGLSTSPFPVIWSMWPKGAMRPTGVRDSASYPPSAAPRPPHPLPGSRRSQPFRSRSGPNPALGSASLGFELPIAGAVRIDIFDVAGRWVRHLLRDNNAPSGPHAVHWDGRNEMGVPVASGVYVARLTADGSTKTARFTWLR